MRSILIKCTAILLVVSPISHAQPLQQEDVQDFDKKTGIGCISKKPVTDKADYYHICKSKKSGEVAWNAALYRSKIACSSGELSVHFKIPPSLPTENGVYGAQVEVSCGKKP